MILFCDYCVWAANGGRGAGMAEAVLGGFASLIAPPAGWTAQIRPLCTAGVAARANSAGLLVPPIGWPALSPRLLLLRSPLLREASGQYRATPNRQNPYPPFSFAQARPEAAWEAVSDSPVCVNPGSGRNLSKKGRRGLSRVIYAALTAPGTISHRKPIKSSPRARAGQALHKDIICILVSYYRDIL